MDIRDMVKDIVRDMVRSELASIIGHSDQLPDDAPDDDDDAIHPRVKGAARRNPDARVTYWLTKRGRGKTAADDLRGNNARVFKVIARKEGLTKRQIWERCKDHVSTPKSAESNIYQLQTAGLVESREV